MELSIIIVNWNGKKWLKGCLDSIYEQSFKDYEIIFIDNHSDDESIEFIKNNYPETIIIANKKNIGFGKANNIGADTAKGNTLFFLNNDTLIEDPDFLKKILQLKKEQNLHIAGPKILSFEKKDIYQGRKISIDCTGYLGWAKETFYVEGCAMFIDRNLFLELGGFDEKYFMYSEDIDLCWRAHLQNKKVDILNEISIIHFGGGTTETTQLKSKEKHAVPFFRKYEVEKNNLRNILKNYLAINILWAVPIYLTQLLMEVIIYFLTGNWKIIKFILKSLRWNIINLRDTLKYRRNVQSARLIGDWQILKKMSFGINKPRAFLIIGMPKFK